MHLQSRDIFTLILGTIASLAMLVGYRHYEYLRNGEVENGGRYRIRTYDFHRVKMALYR